MDLTYGNMRTNGTLRYEIVEGGDLNEYGEPIAAQSDWSDPIPCSIKTNSDTRKGKYEDGIFRQASFIILIELAAFPHKRISLERNGESLGEFDILSSEPLTSVGRTQIVV